MKVVFIYKYFLLQQQVIQYWVRAVDVFQVSTQSHKKSYLLYDNF